MEKREGERGGGGERGREGGKEGGKEGRERRNKQSRRKGVWVIEEVSRQDGLL